MERESKRKAASPDADSRAAKRQKHLSADGDASTETPKSTTEVGLRFLESLKQAKDKTGRPIATHFLTLPDKDEYPSYYTAILLPIAIDTIEEKLNRHGYPNLAAVESDIKRMVSNAKTFNEKTSEVFADAERIRKTASNWMVKHNPAYRDPNYSAVPTPIPEGAANGVVHTGRGQVDATHENIGRPRRATTATQGSPPPAKPKRTGRESAAVSDYADENPEFAGKTFQQAQEQIVNELINYVEEESGLQIFVPFHNLPPRSLTDYYALIKNPVSLNGVKKKVRGQHGRNPPTGVTDFKNWDAFEEEVSFIWRNAREYNEDGSELYNLAGEFEEYFKQRLAEAKEKVEEPAQPTLKLRMTQPKAPSIKLRFGANKDSPAPTSTPDTPATRSSATPGVIVDNEALERQRDHVQAGMNGHRPPSSGTPANAASRNPFGGSRGVPASTPIPTIVQNAERRKSVTTGSPAAPTNGVKSESQPSQSPALNSIRLSSAAPDGKENVRPSVIAQTPQLSASAMPPPNIMPRPATGSPHPQQQIQQQSQFHSQVGLGPILPPGVESMYRPEGFNMADALLPAITLTAHPNLHVPDPYIGTVRSDLEVLVHSKTIHIAPTHHYIQIVPHLPIANTTRPYRLWVTINHMRVSEINRPIGPNGIEREKEKGRPLYEAKLNPGVNRVEVEVFAAPPPPKKGEQEGPPMWEKCTIFLNLTKP